MGLTDVNIYGEKATGTLNALYDQYSQKITEVTQSYFDKDYMKFAETDSEKIVAITSPGDFIEEKIVDLAGEYEDRILGFQCGKLKAKMENKQLLDGGMHTLMLLYVTAIMEVKSSMGIIVAAPTAGGWRTVHAVRT